MVSKSFVALVIFINAVPYKGPEAPPTFEIKAMDRTLNVSVIVVGTFCQTQFCIQPYHEPCCYRDPHHQSACLIHLNSLFFFNNF